jgi:hypothetical protein
MKRACAAGVWTLCVLAAIGCGHNRGEEPRDEQGAAANAPTPRDEASGVPRPITVTGCLTASGDRFVLTDLERGPEKESQSPPPTGQAARSETATESYQLVGNTEDLRQHVGKQVRVSGEAQPPQVAEMRETTPAAPTSGQATGTSGQQPSQRPQPGQPQVRSETETRMEVTQLRVQSVTPTGESCAAETKGEASPGSRRPPQ